MKRLLLATALAATLPLMGTASAVPISTTFNFIPTTTLTADTGNVTTATTITSGAPLKVTSIITDNTGLVSGQTLRLKLDTADPQAIDR